MDYQFDNIEEMQRKRDIEAEGIELGLPGDITLVVRAASDANPAWRAASTAIGKELRRLRNARATNEELRRYLAPQYARHLVKDWRGVMSKGIDVPFSVEACTAFLLAADDAYAAVDQIVYDTLNFRAARVDTIIEHAKN
jgi:hypothetical protein